MRSAGVPFDAWPTERAGHATELARKAVAEDTLLAYLPIYGRLAESVQRVDGAEAGAILHDAHQLVKQAYELAQRFA